MTLAEFRDSLKENEPPRVGELLKALWYDGKGDWDRAHNVVQDIESRDAAAVHAYLHRKEGDRSNAAYWYRRAGVPMHDGALEEEWRELVEKELKN